MKIENMISELRKLVYILRIQDYNTGMSLLDSVIRDLAVDSDHIKDRLVSAYGAEAVLGQLNDINRSLDEEDMIMAADLIEGICIPALQSVVQHKASIHKSRYVIESTSSGWMTVKSDVSGQYLHSNNDPMWEAEELARSIYDPYEEEYLIWGMGFGYLPLKLSELSDGSVKIKVFEEDEELVRLADDYGVGKLLPDRNVDVILDARGSRFSKELGDSDNKGIVIHRASVKKIADDKLRDILLRFYNDYESITHYSMILKRNCCQNHLNINNNADELKGVIKDRDVVIVAAGPSLDESFEFLKESEGKRVLIAVGTVFRKLLKEDIIPDYVFFMDPNPEIMVQLEGAMDTAIPAILGESTYWRIAKEYRGEKYLALMSNLKIIRPDKDNANSEYNTGGSVTTLVLDVVLKQSAKSIYLVGVDLAYKDGSSHAAGTKDAPMTDGGSECEILSNMGQVIKTSEKWNKFRMWIEKEIAEYPDIPVYNLSKTGAYINGTNTDYEG